MQIDSYWCWWMLLKLPGVGWLSVNATKSLRAFVERVFANFCDKNVFFFTISEHSLKAGSSKDLWKLAKSFLKAGWLLLKALQKQADFHWRLYKSRMTFIECSTNAGWLSLRALRKQDDFRSVLNESRTTFVQCNSKAGYLSISVSRWNGLEILIPKHMWKS